MKYFYEKYDRKTIDEIMESRYLIRCKLKLDKERYLSEKYKIKIRNVNNIEIDILKTSVVKIGSKFLDYVMNIQDLKDKDKFEKIQKKYIFDIANYNSKIPISYFIDEYSFIRDTEEVLKIISEGIQRNQIDLTNTKEAIINDIATEYLKDAVILELEDRDRIVKSIIGYKGLDEEDICLYDKFDEFLHQYIELWNLINFKQYEYLGFGIIKFNNSITTVLELREITNDSRGKEIREVLNNLKLIDIDDESVFMFLLSRFNRIEYMDDINRTLLYVSLIEFFLTHKPNRFDLSINKQLKRNIKICYNSINSDISEKEIGCVTIQILNHKTREIIIDWFLNALIDLSGKTNKPIYLKTFIGNKDLVLFEKYGFKVFSINNYHNLLVRKII